MNQIYAFIYTYSRGNMMWGKFDLILTSDEFHSKHDPKNVSALMR